MKTKIEPTHAIFTPIKVEIELQSEDEVNEFVSVLSGAAMHDFSIMEEINGIVDDIVKLTPLPDEN